MLRKKKRPKKISFTLPVNPYRQKYVSSRREETWAAHRGNLTSEPMPASFINLNSHVVQRLDIREISHWQDSQRKHVNSPSTRRRKALFSAGSRTVSGKLLSLNEKIASQLDIGEIAQWINESKDQGVVKQRKLPPPPPKRSPETRLSIGSVSDKSTTPSSPQPLPGVNDPFDAVVPPPDYEYDDAPESGYISPDQQSSGSEFDPHIIAGNRIHGIHPGIGRSLSRTSSGSEQVSVGDVSPLSNKRLSGGSFSEGRDEHFREIVQYRQSYSEPGDRRASTSSVPSYLPPPPPGGVEISGHSSVPLAQRQTSEETYLVSSPHNTMVRTHAHTEHLYETTLPTPETPPPRPPSIRRHSRPPPPLPAQHAETAGAMLLPPPPPPFDMPDTPPPPSFVPPPPPARPHRSPPTPPVNTQTAHVNTPLSAMQTATIASPPPPQPYMHDTITSQPPSQPYMHDTMRSQPPSQPYMHDTMRSQPPSQPYIHDTIRSQPPPQPHIHDSIRSQPHPSPPPPCHLAFTSEPSPPPPPPPLPPQKLPPATRPKPKSSWSDVTDNGHVTMVAMSAPPQPPPSQETFRGAHVSNQHVLPPPPSHGGVMGANGSHPVPPPPPPPPFSSSVVTSSNTAPPSPPPPPPPMGFATMPANGGHVTNRRPPPPPVETIPKRNRVNGFLNEQSEEFAAQSLLPPPPPPPPAPMPPTNGNTGSLLSGLQNVKLKKASPPDPSLNKEKSKPPASKSADGHSDLIAQIQSGIKLRPSPGPKIKDLHYKPEESADSKSSEEIDSSVDSYTEQAQLSPAAKVPPPVAPKTPKPSAGSAPKMPANSVQRDDNGEIQIDPTTLPGYQDVPENCPAWKKAMIEKKNKELEDNAKKEFQKVKEEEMKWKDIPEWRKKLMMEKEKKKTEELAPHEEERKKKQEEMMRLQSMPEWKRNLLMKKRSDVS